MGTRAISVLLLALFGFLGYVPKPIAAEDWSYEDEQAWMSHFQDCKGSQQSPINIISKTAITNKTFPDFKFGTGYQEKTVKATLLNNGHTAQVNTSVIANVTGGPLGTGNYQLLQFHFHWGKNDSYGAEHTLDCRKHSLEVHFVHYNTKYASVKDALGNVGGIAVLGMWLDAQNDIMDNGILKPITDNLMKTKDKNDRFNFSFPMNQSLMSLLPKNVKSYFTYDGSLTTPPCTQNITWTMFTEIQKISHKQLQAFRELDEEPKNATVHHHLEQNFRDIQPVNNRKIYLSASPTQAFPASLCPK